MAAAKKRKRSRGISTGYNPKTGKIGYTRSVKPRKPSGNYASGWAAKFAKDGDA